MSHGSGAEDGANGDAGSGDRAGHGRLDLGVGEGPVGCAEPEGVGERAVAGGDLRPGVDVEQPQRFQQLTRSGAQGSLDVGGRDLGDDDDRDVDLGRRERRRARRHLRIRCRGE
jgi:hypothetical protein